jgi:hypothetical protein
MAKTPIIAKVTTWHGEPHEHETPVVEAPIVEEEVTE